MSEKRQTVVLQTGKSAKIVKWKVKTGMVVTAGCVILLYETHPSSGEAGQQKLKSTSVGTVKSLLAKEGDIIKPGEPLFEVEKCTHPTIMKDMCAECGADLRNEEGEGSPQAGSIPMVHSIPELKVNEEQAQIIGKADEDRLLSERKLVLLVDLDQTLIHTTNDNIPPNLKDVYHFQLHGARSPWYHTRLRPGTAKFLIEMSKIYELHICTFGSRTYAHMIAMFLDPDGKFFSHRILSRDECFSANCKTANLKALFPCGDSLVCIIDDREDVWSFVPNLIHVKPYHFFQHTGDINAPPGLSKRENDDVADYDFNCLGDGQKHENEDEETTEAPKERNKKSCDGEDRSGSLREEPITGDEDSTDLNQEKFSQALKIEPKDEKEEEKTPVDGTNNKSEVEKSKDGTTENKENSLEETEKARNETQGKSHEMEAQPDEVSKYLDGSEKSDQVEANLDGTEKSVQVKEKSDGTDTSLDDVKSGDVEDKKSGGAENPAEGEKSGEAEDERSGEAENPAEGEKSGEAENPAEGEKSGEAENPAEGEKSGEAENPAEGEKSGEAENPAEGEKSGEAEIVKDVKSSRAEKFDESAEPDVASTGNLEQTRNGNKEDEKMESQENGPTDDENKESETPVITNVGEPIETMTGTGGAPVLKNDEIDVQDADDYLLYLEEILKSIHKEFYLRKDAGHDPDLKQIVPEIKACVLKGTSLVFSGLVPNHIQLEYSRAYQVAVSLGANVTQDLIKGTTTHLVAVRPGTAKVNSARRMRNIFVVTADWLWTCAERWERVDEKVFPLGKNRAGTRHPPAHCSPEHPLPETQIQPAIRTRSPSGRFMDTINPLLSFSLADIADMDQEVEDIFNESESDGDEEGLEADANADGKDRPSKPTRRRKRNQQENPSDADNSKGAKRLKQVEVEAESESSSSSADSLSGEHPRGWRQHELRREARAPAGTGTESDPEDDLEESPSSKFRRGEALPSDLDLGEDESASQGSDEPPDEVDDGDWNMMGAALEREFLS